MIRDLAALAVANGAVLAAGHGVLRVGGIRPAVGDLAWSLGAAYVAGAAGIGVLGSMLLVLGLPLLWWQLLLLCAAVAALGLLRRGGLRTPARVVTVGWERVLPAAILVVLAVLAVDLAVQPLWGDDAFLRDRSRPLVLWTVVLAIALAPTLQIQVASAVADVTLAVFFGLAGVAGWQGIERGEGGCSG